MQLLMSLAALAAASASDISSLSWLSGAWAQKGADGRWAEEYWTPPRGHIMIGAGLTGQGGTTRSFEHMRIMADGAGARSPSTACPAALRRSRFRWSGRAESRRLRESRPDYPQRISYRLNGKQLVATASKIDGSNAESWTYDRPN